MPSDWFDRRLEWFWDKVYGEGLSKEEAEALAEEIGLDPAIVEEEWEDEE